MKLLLLVFSLFGCFLCQDYYLINTTRNVFISQTFSKPLHITDLVEELIFLDCIFEDYLMLNPCKTGLGSAEILNGSTTTTIYDANEIVLLSCLFKNTFIEYNSECFTQKDKTVLVRSNNFTILNDSIEYCMNFNMSSDVVSDIYINQNGFQGSQDCNNGNQCRKSAILVSGTSISSLDSLELKENYYDDDVYPFGDIQMSDYTSLRSGITIMMEEGSNFDDFKNVYVGYVIGGYPTDYQEIPRNIKLQNEEMFGYYHDAILLQSDGSTDCNYACKDDCTVCFLDPTRYEEDNICFNKTMFHRLPMMGYLCKDYLEVRIFPVEYPQEITFFNKSFHLIKTIDYDTLGPNGGSYTLLDKPRILHGDSQVSNPFTSILNSIVLGGKTIIMENLEFQVQGLYLFPYVGAFLFTSAISEMDITIKNCDFYGQKEHNVIFNNLIMDDQVDTLYIENSNFEGFKFDLIMNELMYFELVNNSFIDFESGLIDTESTNGFKITGNFANMTSINSICGGIICIQNTGCSSQCVLKDNNIIGPINNDAFLVWVGTNYPVYKLDNTNITINNILGNGDEDSWYGLEYINLPKIPCNYTELMILKSQNVAIKGWEADIICDRGLITEIECSLSCNPDIFPPNYCLVNQSVTFLDEGFGYSVFPSIKSALAGCLSNPIMKIVVVNGFYDEGSLTFDQADVLTQFAFEITSYSTINPQVFVIGHSHTASSQFVNFTISNMFFHSQDFTNNASTLPLTSVNHILIGALTNVEMTNLVFKGNPDSMQLPIEDNTPDVSVLLQLFVTSENKGLEMKNVVFAGSKSIGVVLKDGNSLDGDISSKFHIENVFGYSHQGGFIDIQGIGHINLTNIECVKSCGGVVETDSIIKIINKEIFVTSKLKIFIDRLKVVVDNSTYQFSLTNLVPGGTGYTSGIWIENPAESASVVDYFVLQDLISLNYPVGMRYYDMSEVIIHLSEPMGSSPISLDAKRGMRETARYNNIEGTIYDMKNGEPTNDDFLDPINTCNDLCIPLDQLICKVDKDYLSSVLNFGLTKFHTIQEAIQDCTSPLIPMQIMLFDTESGGIVTTIHEENVVFNSSKSIHLYGTVGSTDSSRVQLVGTHKVREGVCVDLIIEDLIMLPFENGSSINALISQEMILPTVDYHLTIVNVLFKTGYPTSTFSNAVIDLDITGNVIIQNVIIQQGFETYSKGLLDFHFHNESILQIENTEVQHSLGSQIIAKDLSDLKITGSIFQNCGEGSGITIPACIFVSTILSGTIETSGNTINRILASSVVSLIGTYFTGFWLEKPIILNSTSDTGGLEDLEEWSITNNIGVGIRIDGVTFTPDYLLLAQLTQKFFARGLSQRNPGIDTTFHDIVINNDDNLVETDPSNNERLFCTDGCPSKTYDLENWIFIGISLGVIVLMFLILCFCPFVCLMITRERGIISPSVGLQKYKFRKKLRNLLQSGDINTKVN